MGAAAATGAADRHRRSGCSGRRHPRHNCAVPLVRPRALTSPPPRACAGTTADLDLWHYSYPLKANHVPAWAVPCVATLTPLAVILGCFLGGRISRVEAHHACLLVVSCVATTGLLTNWIKCHVRRCRVHRCRVGGGPQRELWGLQHRLAGPAIAAPGPPFAFSFDMRAPPNPPSFPRLPLQVGRPRPHFVNRCWPNGARPVFAPDGTPLCADGAINPEEGIKSFPSGEGSAAAASHRHLCRGSWGGGGGGSPGEPVRQAGRWPALAGGPHAVPRPPLLLAAPGRVQPPAWPPPPCLSLAAAGHTSWSTSGLGFLTFWLLGHLHVFSHGAAMPSRFVVALCPLLGAVWIGMSRIQDYWCGVGGGARTRGVRGRPALAVPTPAAAAVLRCCRHRVSAWRHARADTPPSLSPCSHHRHHVEDVCAGFSLGLLMAFCYYRQAYEGLLSQHAGTLTAALRSSGRSGVLAPSSSRFGLLYPSGGGSDGSGEELPLSVPLYADDRV